MRVELIEVPSFPFYPSYPYRKVVVVGDRGEVADFPSEGESTENIVTHRELEIRLVDKHPELKTYADFTAGLLTQSGDEATLYLYSGANRLGAEACDRVGRALSEWCHTSGVHRLLIAVPEPGNGWKLP